MQPVTPGAAAGAWFPARVGTLPQDLLAELCEQAVQQLQSGKVSFDAPQMCQRCRTAGVEISPADLSQVLRILSWLFGTAAKNKLTSEEFSADVGKRFGFLPQQSAQVIQQVWKEKRESLVVLEDVKPMAAAGQLIDFQWKLGIAMSADSCKSLKSPCVTVALKVADSLGNITQKSFEMTIAQFQAFRFSRKKLLQL
ncbi:COMM domain-containing protein 6 isoform X2 [Thamnophis elegans]|uniref:COMM domain-containing protein 6 isoform X2 n=1 Tax=Thamnophis elegans TaxID=35005 RepID=UPI001378B25E|nr:COMM domain-containing protein 6 isoform X2 [Thamnophis elegans]